MTPSHVYFLHSARRRWAAWHVVESAGIGAGAGAAAGMAVVAVLVWRDQPALGTAALFLLIGGLAGAAWGLTRPPTLLQTAMRIDQQLKLADLLSSTLQSSSYHDEQFHAVMIGQAQAVCASLSPGVLIVRRLGGRGWGGIGIVTSLLLSLALMSSRPEASIAQSERVNPFIESGSSNESVAQLNPSSAAIVLPRNSSNRPGGDDSRADQAASSNQDSSQAGRQFTVSANSNRTRSGDGTGDEAGRSDDGRVARLDQRSQASGDNEAAGLLIAGGTRASQPPSQSLSSIDGNVPDQPAAATRSEFLPEDHQSVTRALSEVQSGQVPDIYRDLVRRYFTPN